MRIILTAAERAEIEEVLAAYASAEQHDAIVRESLALDVIAARIVPAALLQFAQEREHWVVDRLLRALLESAQQLASD